MKVFKRSGLKPQNLFGLLILPWLLKVCSCKMLEPSPLATDTVAKVSVTVSSCCCRKLLQVQWLLSRICYFSNSGCQGVQKKVSAGLYPFSGASGGKPVHCCFWLTSSHLHSLTCSLPPSSKPAAKHLESLFKKIIYRVKKIGAYS